MGQNLNEVKEALAAADAKADKIAADVTLLHGKIDNVNGETPTAEEWAEVKALATNLNNKLQNIDDQTAEEVVEPEQPTTPEEGQA